MLIDKKPQISIITAVFNGEEFLEETIQSVINQTYPNVEYIVVDGGSTDGTLDILRKYNEEIDIWISEPDTGISDAFNKGVNLATGDYINFQGDGDGFISSDSLERFFENINPEEDILLCGRVQRIDLDGSELYVSKKFPDKFNKKSLLFKMALPHQGLFTHQSYFGKYGLFDVNNIYSMDYEHILRSYTDFPKIVLKNIVVARWRNDGLGTGKMLEILNEYHQNRLVNKVAKSYYLSLIKHWSFFKYFIKNRLKKIKGSGV